MKFEKISDNKLKITLNGNELPSVDNKKIDYKSTDLDSLMADSSSARDSFLYLLELANKEVGFDTKNFKIKIQAKALYNGTYSFIVTKLIRTKKVNSVVKPKKIFKKRAVDEYSIYRFSCFDDFNSFSDFIRSKKFDLSNFCSSNTLYSYGNFYFLSIENINMDCKNISLFISTITEFGEYFSSSSVFDKNLKEHGIVISKL